MTMRVMLRLMLVYLLSMTARKMENLKAGRTETTESKSSMSQSSSLGCWWSTETKGKIHGKNWFKTNNKDQQKV